MKRSFDEDEARRILDRAAERHEAAERAALGAGDLSLDELEAIAAEVGIDPEHVRTAAGELVLREATAPAKSRLGLPSELRETRIVPGDVSDEVWRRMVEALRAEFRTPGSVAGFGSRREWHAHHGPKGEPGVQVGLERTEEGTVITLRHSTAWVPVVAASLGGTLGASALMIGIAGYLGPGGGSVATVAVVFAVLAVVVGAGSLAVGGWWAKHRARKLEQVADRLELAARSGPAEKG